jgi:proline iminopeptidase
LVFVVDHLFSKRLRKVIIANHFVLGSALCYNRHFYDSRQGKMALKAYAKLHGLNIYYEFYGEHDNGKPTVVIVPGGPGFGMAGYQSAHMGFLEQANLLFYDPMGCGKSERPRDETTYSLANSIKEFSALIDYFDEKQGPQFSKNLIILGTSYGGMVATGYACGYQLSTLPRLAHLIVVASSVHFGFSEKARQNVFDQGDQAQIDICENYLWPGKLTDKNLPVFFSLMKTLYSYKARIAEKPVKNYNDPCNVTFLNALLASNFDRFDFRDHLPRITVPVDWICGYLDWITVVEQADDCEKYIPMCTCHRLENCSHSVAIDQTERYADILTGVMGLYQKQGVVA